MPEKLCYFIEGSENIEEGIGPTCRLIKAKDGLIKGYLEGCNTLYDMFCYGVKKNPKALCLGKREVVEGKLADCFSWQTYEEVEKVVNCFGNGLLKMDLIKEIPYGEHKTTNGTNYKLVAIFSKNRKEWVISEQGIFSVNATIIPIYDTFSVESIRCILVETGLETIICGNSELPSLIEICKDTNPQILLKNLIIYDPIPEDLNEAVNKLNLKIITYQSIIELGSKSEFIPTPPNELDPAFVFYTSGATGAPKGVIMLHQNLTSVSQASLAHHPLVYFPPGSFYLSYLPLPHVFEQFIHGIIYSSGGAVGFYSGDRSLVLEDLKVLRPTIFASVPRIFGRMKDKVLETVSKAGGITSWLFHKGLLAKEYYLKDNTVNHWLYDFLVFKKVRKMLGFDRLTLSIVGSAPMTPSTLEFLRCLLCVPVLQGFGMTESSGGLCCTWPGDVTTSNDCGVLIQASEMRLVSVPDMGYKVTDKYHGRVEEEGKIVSEGNECLGRGELVCRGYNRTPGYFRRPELTAEFIDKDGWFHTGDVALITPEYKLQIIDRIKNILKLSQGEYVAVENLENVYVTLKLVVPIDFQSYLVAIIVPDEQAAKTWANEFGVLDKTINAICQLKEFKKVVLDDINCIVKEKKLNGIERIRDIYLESTPFSIEEGMLTPTMKLRRIDLKRKYADTISNMYSTPASK